MCNLSFRLIIIDLHLGHTTLALQLMARCVLRIVSFFNCEARNSFVNLDP